MNAASQRGAALLMVLLILLFLLALGSALLTSTTMDAWVGDNYRTSVQARYLAQAGIEAAREQLRLAGTSLSGLLAPAGNSPYLTGGDASGSYQVWLRNDLSEATSLSDTNGMVILEGLAQAGASHSRLEVLVRKGSFPALPPVFPPDPATLDTELNTVSGLERIVRAVGRNATDVFNPLAGSATVLGNYGSPAGYRVGVVHGDCVLGPGAGFGFLLVRGNLSMTGNFTWNGLIAVIGKGTLLWPGGVYGQITGGVFVARTHLDDGTPLAVPGAATLDLSGAGSTGMQHDAVEIARANASFPYLTVAVREY